MNLSLMTASIFINWLEKEVVKQTFFIVYQNTELGLVKHEVVTQYKIYSQSQLNYIM